MAKKKSASFSASDFSEDSLWNKLAKYAKAAGREVVEMVLTLYYTAQAPETPVSAKVIIYSALVYFITPMDAVPDWSPFVGYSDDLGVLMLAMATVAAHITPEIEKKAKEKADEWFGEE